VFNVLWHIICSISLSKTCRASLQGSTTLISQGSTTSRASFPCKLFSLSAFDVFLHGEMKGEWSGIFYYVREVNFHLRIWYPFTEYVNTLSCKLPIAVNSIAMTNLFFGHLCTGEIETSQPKLLGKRKRGSEEHGEMTC